VTLNLPGRDAKIEEYKNYLRNLAKAGVFYTTYAHMGNGIWSSEREFTRGGASARAFDQAKNPKGHWVAKVFEGPLTHGRKFSKDELLGEFIPTSSKQVVPVAEELGIRIGIHPDDPPVPELGGVPRSIFGNFDGYVRALEIANSPNVGVCLCAARGWKGARKWARTYLKQHEPSPRWINFGRFISETSARRSLTLLETFVDNGLYGYAQTDEDAPRSGLPRRPDRRPRAGHDRRNQSRLGLQYWIYQSVARRSRG